MLKMSCKTHLIKIILRGSLRYCVGGLNFPLPVPFNPGSRPVFVGSYLCIFSIVKYWIMLHNFSLFLLLSITLGILLPPPSSPFSCTPPACFSPDLPPPPVPLHIYNFTSAESISNLRPFYLFAPNCQNFCMGPSVHSKNFAQRFFL